MRTAFFLFVVLLLTLLTQVGGVFLLMCWPLLRWVKQRLARGQRLAQVSLFLAFYLLSTFTWLPWLAAAFGRVPLPVHTSALRPLSLLTCVLNRHYVHPALRTEMETVAAQFAQQHPGSVVSYLDAGFPFLSGFPLLPHLSHDDGRKLDLAFFYQDAAGTPVNGIALTPLAYGGYEQPRPGEIHTAARCRAQGYWQYGLLGSLFPQTHSLQFDESRTEALIRLLAQQPQTEKIFLEPHLVTRLQLEQISALRFHGCRAVRHDDHIHWQIR
ncbi:hypothetical protein SAMN05421823_105269 [Catalinimonas alkaloidigena]|uniref:Uncharacterized protein n=1 Tax=Catalinimonas alkaloidigena TaxID=1075417 RepID=A0A1G9JCW9_9BACT|nr:hypothetical protein [Catalinimonas alkaloidigena]SDL34964.1 hypothetical protein SAMN05421823_105269 [Catalinimonas alkaloidigena]